MVTDENYEKEVDLKELCFKVLYGWRFIILISLLCAILLGAYKLVSNIQLINDSNYKSKQEAEYKKNLKKYETDKSKLEEEIRNLKASIDRQQKYNEKSILMKIDPYDKPVANISYFIDTNFEIPNMTYRNMDEANYIINSFVTIALNGDMYNYVMDHLSYDIELKYLKEIVTFSSDYKGEIIYVVVTSTDQEHCQEIVSLIKDYFEQIHTKVNQSIGEFDLAIIDESVNSVIDFNLEVTQTNKLELVKNYNAELILKQNELAGLYAPTKFTLTNAIIVKAAIKFMILGFLVGFILAIVLLILIFMVSDKLLNQRQLRVCFNLRILGKIVKKKKRFCGFVDQCFMKLEGVKTPTIDEEEEIKIISANLKVLLAEEEKQIHKILFTGSINVNRIEEISKKVSAILPKASYDIGYGANINYNSKTVELFSEYEKVVLVEEINKSTNTQIKNELDSFKDLGKEVLGVVYFS